MTDTFYIWYVDLSCWEEEPYCFWWRSKVIWGHRRSNSKNLVIELNFPIFGPLKSLKLVFNHLTHLAMWETPHPKIFAPSSLACLATGLNGLLTCYLKTAIMDTFMLSLVFAFKIFVHLATWRLLPLPLPPRKRFAPPLPWLAMISQDSNYGNFSYLVYRFAMFRGRTLLFLVEVKGHLRSPEVKYHPSVVIRSQKTEFPKNSQDWHHN